MIRLCKPFDSEKENILFLHGFLESSETWDPFVSELSIDYNCILYDFPGHGLNQSYPSNQIKFEFICRDIISSLNELNFKEVHLICHSMGGFFGCYLKDNYPNYIKKIILSNSTIEKDTDTQLKKREKIKRIVKSSLSLLCKVSFTDYNKKRKEIKESICLSSNPEHLIEYQNILAKREDYTNLFDRFHLDFFFIFGENDRQIPWKRIQLKTKKRQYILQNEGHILPLRSKQEWLSAVLRALK